MTSLTIAVEDALSERLLLRTLALVRKDISVHYTLGLRGNAYLRKIARGLNQAAQGSGYVMLTDQDDPNGCPVSIVSNWLGGNPRHPNFLFRVAVMESESWLLADRDEIAAFLGVPLARVTSNPDGIVDPKQHLVNLARSSNRSTIRDDLVPRPGGTARVGPNYNGRLAMFIDTKWSCVRAGANSGSLSRLLRRLQDYRVDVLPRSPS